MTNEIAYNRAADILAAHKQKAGLEGDGETILIHLLGDLIEWCEAQAVDLDLALENARAVPKAEPRGQCL